MFYIVNFFFIHIVNFCFVMPETCGLTTKTRTIRWTYAVAPSAIWTTVSLCVLKQQIVMHRYTLHATLNLL